MDSSYTSDFPVPPHGFLVGTPPVGLLCEHQVHVPSVLGFGLSKIRQTLGFGLEGLGKKCEGPRKPAPWGWGCRAAVCICSTSGVGDGLPH